jgi:hypothetical protein
MVKRGKAEQGAARSSRLATALRENLKRRKAQARGRSGGGAPDQVLKSTGNAATAAEGPDFRRNPGRNSEGGTGGPGR